jgi:hypothetical protein
MRDKSILGVRTWRMERGITLEFKRLPGGIYDTNYIRQYADAISFSAPELLNVYHASCRGESPALVMLYS